VKIADFGIAKILRGTDEREALTQAQGVVGTPHYMAPEQVEHPQAVDHRADIYSLGVVFYEMLTGELPLGRFEPPSCRARTVNVDVRLDEVVLRALERQPERRYQQASQVKSDLETIAGPSGQKPPLSAPGAAAGMDEQERMRKEVRGPALGLVATGILNWVLLPIVFALFLPALSRARAAAAHAQTEDLTQMAVLVLVATPFVLCSFMIYAGIKMMRFEAYRAAVGASIVAMLVTPGNLIGFPAGIWALITLARQEIRVAFQRARAALPTSGGAGGRKAAGQFLLWGAAAVVVLAGLVVLRGLHRNPALAPAATPIVLEASTSSDKPLSEDLALTPEGAWQASCTSTQVFRVFEVPDPRVENCIVLYQAKVKTEGLRGRAYLEMWCRFPGQGEAFSRGFDNVVSGTTGWVNCQTPFFLKAGEKPDLIRLNLVVEGPGKVSLKDIRLEATPSRQ
jgi:hypothetical protein